MPLHRCLQCGYKTVADDAFICPQCGTKEHDIPPAWKFILAGIVAILFSTYAGPGFFPKVVGFVGLMAILAGIFRSSIKGLIRFFDKGE